MSVVEVACDESGFSGTNLLDPRSPVITHGSVDLDAEAAAEVIAVLRSHHRSEFKSNQLLRPRQRPALEWLLTTLRGRAYVHVIDKTAYVAARVIELFADEPTYAAGTQLGRPSTEAVDALRAETDFLTAFTDLTRTKRVRLMDYDAVDRFFATMPAGVPILEPLTRRRVLDVMQRLIDEDPEIPPPLEPLVPALAETILFWTTGGRSVAITHDEQSALTPGRVSRLGAFLADHFQPPPLNSFTQVDSRQDPRVQVADLLAGITRHLTQNPNPHTTTLLAPYLTPTPTAPTT